VTFSDVSEPEVNIPDPNLRERIEAKFGKQPGAPITESEMATLIYLEADHVDISDLAGLEFATNLTELWLGENEISNISVLSGLTNLTVLDLSGNSISDLSPLVANIGLYEVDVRENPVNDTSITIHIPALQSRGVEVFFNNPTPQTLLKISGDNQKIASSVALATPFVVEVQDQNGAAFKGAPVRFAVTSGGGTLSVENAETDANGRAQSTLTLGTDVGKNTVEVTVEDIQQTQIFTANAVNN
jgi:Leucine-rich repeat (LRR) protein